MLTSPSYTWLGELEVITKNGTPDKQDCNYIDVIDWKLITNGVYKVKNVKWFNKTISTKITFVVHWSKKKERKERRKT